MHSVKKRTTRKASSESLTAADRSVLLLFPPSLSCLRLFCDVARLCVESYCVSREYIPIRERSRTSSSIESVNMYATLYLMILTRSHAVFAACSDFFASVSIPEISFKKWDCFSIMSAILQTISPKATTPPNNPREVGHMHTSRFLPRGVFTNVHWRADS